MMIEHDRHPSANPPLAMGAGPWGGNDPAPESRDKDDPDGSPDAGDQAPAPRPQPWQLPPVDGHKGRPQRGAFSGPGGQPDGLSAIDRFWMFVRDSVGGDPGGPAARKLLLIGGAIVVAAWLVGTSVHHVAAGERGIVTRFGAYQGTLAPGIGLTLPAPVDAVDTVNVDEIHSTDLGGSGATSHLLLTADGNLVALAYNVRWAIADARQYTFATADPDKIIGSVAESAMRGAVAQMTLEQVFRNGRQRLPDVIAQRLRTQLSPQSAGVRIEQVTVNGIALPDKIGDVNKAIEQARKDAQDAVNRAEAYASQVRLRARGDAAAFDKVYEQYRLAPDVTRKRLYYDMMDQVLSRSDKIIIGSGNTQYTLPAPVAAAPAKPAAPAPAPAPAQATEGK